MINKHHLFCYLHSIPLFSLYLSPITSPNYLITPFFFIFLFLELIFNQSFYNNFCDNFLFHTNITFFTLSLYYFGFRANTYFLFVKIWLSTWLSNKWIFK